KKNKTNPSNRLPSQSTTLPPLLHSRHLLPSITTATLHSDRRDRTRLNRRLFPFLYRPI
ncbi:unnamed protein product, partial [Prunus brigantina]